jgi:hypothetical protein
MRSAIHITAHFCINAFHIHQNRALPLVTELSEIKYKIPSYMTNVKMKTSKEDKDSTYEREVQLLTACSSVDTEHNKDMEKLQIDLNRLGE